MFFGAFQSPQSKFKVKFLKNKKLYNGRSVFIRYAYSCVLPRMHMYKSLNENIDDNDRHK
jgi:hypothetical protein